MAFRPAPSLKTLALVASLLLGIVIVALSAFAPVDSWIEVIAPRQTAVARLQETGVGPIFSLCPFGPSQRWQLIKSQPDAARLFDEVIVGAQRPIGMLYGLAGLATVDSVRFARTRDSLLSTRAHDSLDVSYEGSYEAHWHSMSEALSKPSLDSVIALLSRPQPQFEC